MTAGAIQDNQFYTPKTINNTPMRARRTYHFQPPPTQDPLRSRRNTPPIALQIPHDIPSIQLREHLRYLLDLCWIDGIPARTTATATSSSSSSAWFAVPVQEPADDEERDDGQGEQRGDVD